MSQLHTCDRTVVTGDAFSVICDTCSVTAAEEQKYKYQAAEEQRHPKASVETPRVVSLIPARHQACRINHPHLYRF